MKKNMKKNLYLVLILLASFFNTIDGYSQDSLGLTSVGRWQEYRFTALATNGYYIYKGNSNFFSIYLATNPDKPVLISKIRTDVLINKIIIDGNTAIITGEGIGFLDISSSYNPSVIATDTTFHKIGNPVINGNYLYYLSGDRLKAVDIGDPRNLKSFRPIEKDTLIEYISTYKNQLFVGYYDDTLRCLKVDIYSLKAEKSVFVKELFMNTGNDYSKKSDYFFFTIHDSLILYKNQEYLCIKNYIVNKNTEYKKLDISQPVVLNDSLLFGLSHGGIYGYNIKDWQQIEKIYEGGSSYPVFEPVYITMSDRYLITSSTYGALMIIDLRKFLYPKSDYKYRITKNNINSVISGSVYDLIYCEDTIKLYDKKDFIHPNLISNIYKKEYYKFFYKNYLIGTKYPYSYIANNDTNQVYFLDISQLSEPQPARSISFRESYLLGIIKDSVFVFCENRASGNAEHLDFYDTLYFKVIDSNGNFRLLSRIKIDDLHYNNEYLITKNRIYYSEDVNDGFGGYKIKCIDLSDPSKPAILPDYYLVDDIFQQQENILYVDENYLIIPSPFYHPNILDITDFSNIKIIGNIPWIDNEVKLILTENRVIVFTEDYCEIYESQDKNDIKLIGFFQSNNPIIDIHSMGNLLKIFYYNGEISFYDIDRVSTCPQYTNRSSSVYGLYQRFFYRDAHLYLSEEDQSYYPYGIKVLDVSNPDVIKESGYFRTINSGSILYKDYLFCYGKIDYKRANKIDIFRLKDENNLEYYDSLEIGEEIYNFFITGDLISIVSGSQKLNVFSFEKPEQPRKLVTYKPPFNVKYMQAWNERLIMSGYSDSILCVNISNPDQPFVEFTIKTNRNYRPYQLFVYKDILFFSGDYDSIWYADLAGKKRKQTEFKQSYYSINNIEFQNNLMFISAGKDGLHVVDITDIVNPREVGKFLTPYSVTDVHVQDSMVYISDYYNGIYILKMNSLVTGVEPEQAESPVTATITPNPASDHCTLELLLGEGGNVELELVDMFGRKVLEIADEYRPAGRNVFSFDTYSCPSGVYFVTGLVNNRRIAEKVIIK